jgi:hypothetical protein
MDTLVETPAADASADAARLPVDVDAQPVVQAALALRSVLRHYHEQIEREQHLPQALVAQLHAAGFYRMVIPRALGGLQVDPLTLPARRGTAGRGRRLGRLEPCQQQHRPTRHAWVAGRGRHEIYPPGHATVIAGTAVQGGGQAVPVAGGYRVTGTGPSAAAAARAPGCWGASRSSMDGNRGAGRMVARCIGAGCFRARNRDRSGKLGRGRAAWHRQLRLDGEGRFLPERRTMAHAGVPVDNQWSRWPGITYALPSQAGSGRTIAR